MQFWFKLLEVDTHKQKRQNPSQVQDHQANKRTYLAWMRAAIALMGFGVAEERLRNLQPVSYSGNGWKLGLLFCVVGLVTVLISTGHYFAVRRDINKDTYEPADRWVLLFSLAVTSLGAAAIYFFFTIAFSPVSTFVPE